MSKAGSICKAYQLTGCHVPKKTGSLSLVSAKYFSIWKRSFNEYLICLIFKFATLFLFVYIINLVVDDLEDIARYSKE